MARQTDRRPARALAVGRLRQHRGRPGFQGQDRRRKKIRLRQEKGHTHPHRQSRPLQRPHRRLHRSAADRHLHPRGKRRAFRLRQQDVELCVYERSERFRHRTAT